MKTILDESVWLRKQMPNPLRTVAEGDDIYTVFINVWADDVSGNVSKQMNPHKNIYVTNASLPGRLLQQEFHVKFVSTSQHASTAEQMDAIRELTKYEFIRHIYTCVNALNLHS